MSSALVGVTYRFAGSQMFHETVFLAGLIFLAFLSYIFVGRANLRITRKGEKKLLDMKEVCLVKTFRLAAPF